MEPLNPDHEAHAADWTPGQLADQDFIGFGRLDVGK